MNADDAKQIINSMNNGGYTDYNKLQYKPVLLTNAYNQVKNTILPAVLKLNPIYETYVKEKGKKKKKAIYNIAGKVAAKVYQALENDCLQVMDKAFTELGFLIGVWCYDGLMVRKQKKKITKKILLEICKQVKEQTGYEITLKIKPMNEGWIVPDDYSIQNEYTFETNRIELI